VVYWFKRRKTFNEVNQWHFTVIVNSEGKHEALRLIDNIHPGIIKGKMEFCFG